MHNSSPRLVTVFGGGGFIGRYVCEMLLKSGVRVRVAQRNAKAAFFLQPLGGMGQLDIVRSDVGNPASVAAAVTGADAVINLVAIMGGAMLAVNATGAGNVAAAAAAGATTLVHISAIGADPHGASRYSQSKGDGEAAVRAAFPSATIIRPSLVFGPEDQLTNRFAGLLAMLPLYPVIAPRTRFQPVYVRDLAAAIAAATLDPAKHRALTYEIGGPQVMTMRDLTAAIGSAAGQSTGLVDMPDFAASLMSRFGFLPLAPLTRDQWISLQSDNVVGATALGLAEFGIDPVPLAAVAPEWLGRFRKGGRFAARATPRSMN
ncbi:MAG: complex I NDUFA9 subunit family protein [Sphingomonas bacterium]|nr:complex I NDUFA9 subunit family protein [Sphingomonas bacterium]